MSSESFIEGSDLSIEGVINIFGNKNSAQYKKELAIAKKIAEKNPNYDPSYESCLDCYADHRTICIEVWWSKAIAVENIANKFQLEISKLGFQITKIETNNTQVTLTAHDPAGETFPGDLIERIYKITCELMDTIELALMFS